MTRLIDAEALKRNMEFVCMGIMAGTEPYNAPLTEIDNAPTVPQINIFCEDADERAIEDMKAELQNVLDSEKSQGEWIPVSERLPERNKEVIVTDIETKDTYCSWYHGNGYWECDNGVLKNRIIAWQPLPEPYKEGDKE